MIVFARQMERRVSMSDRKGDTQEIYGKRRMQDGKQAKEKIPMKPESRSKSYLLVWLIFHLFGLSAILQNEKMSLYVFM